MNFFLFQILPYIAMVIMTLGCILRFDRDPYSWRSKSSQLLSNHRFILASNLFHIGILTILFGHFVGLLTPVAVFDALGISHSFKQGLAIVVGGLAGIACLIGLLMLLQRRLTDPRIKATSSKADIAVLILLLIQLALGLLSIPVSLGHMDGETMVKLMQWAQHIVTFRAGADQYVAEVSLIFKLHITFGMIILMIFPFTRLVHVFSAPVLYVLRPYQIVRKRES